MLKTFALLAFVWNPATGQSDAYVIDYGLSGEDCVAVALDVAASDGFEVEPGHVVPAAALSLACELERT